MNLLGPDDLERSPVVANCRMNRERGLDGSNGYSRDLGFSPLDRLIPGQPFRWLDLCCGTGKALIEASRIVRDQGCSGAEITGVDLVGMFQPVGAPLPGLRLIEASLTTWNPSPDLPFDLITCVHGLHYIGDKLDLITRAAGWLAADGLFVANLDLHNLQITGDPTRRALRANLRRSALDFDPRRRLIRCQGRRTLELPYRYLGADDTAGPNFTGQPAVTSFYEPTLAFGVLRPGLG